MNGIIRFRPRAYRSTKVRKAREVEVIKILERREAIAKKYEEDRKKKEKEQALFPPVLSALKGEDFARISAPDKENTD